MAMVPNGIYMHAEVDPIISVRKLKQVVVPVTSSSAPHYVHLSAINPFGTGPTVLSNLPSVITADQSADQVREVYAGSLSNTEILVQWESPLNDMGEPSYPY